MRRGSGWIGGPRERDSSGAKSEIRSSKSETNSKIQNPKCKKPLARGNESARAKFYPKRAKFAAQEANLAWQKLTGRNPPVTDAFRVLIFSLLGDGECEREAEPEPVIATAVGSVEQASLAVRG